MAVVVFDPAEFKLQFPQFVNVNNATLEFYFDEASLYLTNDSGSAIENLNRRKRLLYLLTAHLAILFGALNTNGSIPVVGRVESATEGSVSASFKYDAPFTMEWFIQTQYGAAFWQSTSSDRGFRYFSSPQVMCFYNNYQ